VVHDDGIEPERSPLSGRLFAIAGAVLTSRGVIEVGVAGDPTVIDLCVEERLDVDAEGLRDTLDNIATGRRTLAAIDLDEADAQRLILLLTQAIELRRQIVAAPPPRPAADAAG
jgi:hypothetical protein